MRTNVNCQFTRIQLGTKYFFHDAIKTTLTMAMSVLQPDKLALEINVSTSESVTVTDCVDYCIYCWDGNMLITAHAYITLYNC